METNTRSEPQTRKKISDAKRVANQDLPKKQAKSQSPVKLIGADDGVNDGDDEIQIIAQQSSRTSNNKPSGHIRAHKPQATKHTHSRGHTTAPPNAPKAQTEKRKPRRPTDPQEVVVVEERVVENENPSAAKAEKTRENTRRNLTRMHRLRSNQIAYSQGKKKNKEKGGPEQDAYKMGERLTLNHNAIIMPEGHAGLVRDMTIPFKAKHGEDKLTEAEKAKKRTRERDREANGRALHVPDGQMMQHVRLQKKRFMGVSDRKHVCGHAYQLRLAQARNKLIKESIPKIKPSVLIKPKDGRRAYIRDDPRLTEALRSMNHIKRAQEPHDANINPLFTAWVKKTEDEIKLIQIDSENEAEIDNEPTDTLSKKVSLSNFLVRPGLLGNDSGAEDEFQKDGTQLLVKEEVRS